MRNLKHPFTTLETEEYLGKKLLLMHFLKNYSDGDGRNKKANNI